MKQCPNCPTSNPSEAQFCQHCGWSLDFPIDLHAKPHWFVLREQSVGLRQPLQNPSHAPQFCTHCNGRNTPSAVACIHCGWDLHEVHDPTHEPGWFRELKQWVKHMQWRQQQAQLNRQQQQGVNMYNQQNPYNLQQQRPQIAQRAPDHRFRTLAFWLAAGLGLLVFLFLLIVLLTWSMPRLNELRSTSDTTTQAAAQPAAVPPPTLVAPPSPLAQLPTAVPAPREPESRSQPPNKPEDNHDPRWSPGSTNEACNFSIEPGQARQVPANCAVSGDVKYSMNGQEPWTALYDNRRSVGLVVWTEIPVWIMAPSGASVMENVDGAVIMQQDVGCNEGCADVSVLIIDASGAHLQGETALPPAGERYVAPAATVLPAATAIPATPIPTLAAVLPLDGADIEEADEGDIVVKIPSRTWIQLDAGMVVAGDVGFSYEKNGDLTQKHDSDSNTCAAVLLNEDAWVYINGDWDAEAVNRDIESVKSGMETSGCEAIEYSWP